MIVCFYKELYVLRHPVEKTTWFLLDYDGNIELQLLSVEKGTLFLFFLTNMCEITNSLYLLKNTHKTRQHCFPWYKWKKEFLQVNLFEKKKIALGMIHSTLHKKNADKYTWPEINFVLWDHSRIVFNNKQL